MLKSKLKFLIFFCLISEVFMGELVKPPGGNGWFITGRGCGVSTKIKYLTYIPEDLDYTLQIVRKQKLFAFFSE